MTWLDLYNFLNKQANRIENIGNLQWDGKVIVHNAETGEEFECDTFYISEDDKTNDLKLVINHQEIYN